MVALLMCTVIVTTAQEAIGIDTSTPPRGAGADEQGP